jgi:5-methylcytosine-specific restriction endonuclease McrA
VNIAEEIFTPKGSYMGNRVFVLDAEKQPLMPCHPARARELLRKGKAAVYRMYPFTIILKHRIGGDVQPIAVKVDPGSRTTGVAVVQEETGRIVFAAEIEHRGQAIKKALDSRRASRRSRRNRKTRYRKPRFLNHTKPKGWLPPSLESRVANVLTWVNRLRHLCPVAAISMELVRFDLQQMENPEIAGVEYQQGTLAGYECREYLLEKWEHRCAYCGKTDVPLQIEHILARSNGGTDRVSNLALACEPCNQSKGNRPIEDFLKGKSDLLAKIQRQARAPLRDATAVNSMRWVLFDRLKATGLPVECGSGGRTKFNRTQQGYPKSHWIDAACVGVSGESVRLDPSQPFLSIKAMGRGKHQVCRTDKFGFPSRWCSRTKRVQGFRTGDIVRAEISSGKYAGVHVGRVAVRATGRFRIGPVDVNVRHVRMVQRVDGYQYTTLRRDPSHP